MGAVGEEIGGGGVLVVSGVGEVRKRISRALLINLGRCGCLTRATSTLDFGFNQHEYSEN